MLEVEGLFAGRYRLIEELGQGGFSSVWRAADQMADDTEIALKVYAPDRGLDTNGIKQFRKEYALLANLHHSHLLAARYFDVWEKKPYLVMPLMTGGSLNDVLFEKGVFNEHQISTLLKQVCEGLIYLHSNGIIHQDIKPDNILLDGSGRYLITDFGISSRMRSTLNKSTNVLNSMTVAYAPPERFDAVPKILPEGDIFSLGVMLCELISGDVPWMGDGGVKLKLGAEIPDLSKFTDSNLSEWIRSMLSIDPRARPKLAQLMKASETFISEAIWIKTPNFEIDKTQQKIDQLSIDVNQLMANDPVSKEAKQKLLEILNLQTDNEFAIQKLKGIADAERVRIDRIDALFLNVAELQKQNKFDELQDIFKEILNLDPHNQKAMSGLERVQAAQADREEQVESLLEQATELRETDPASTDTLKNATVQESKSVDLKFSKPISIDIEQKFLFKKTDRKKFALISFVILVLSFSVIYILINDINNRRKESELNILKNKINSLKKSISEQKYPALDELDLLRNAIVKFQIYDSVSINYENELSLVDDMINIEKKRQDDISSRLKRANSHLKKSSYNSAKKEYLSILNIDPDNIIAIESIGKINKQLEINNVAVKSIDSLKKYSEEIKKSIFEPNQALNIDFVKVKNGEFYIGNVDTLKEKIVLTSDYEISAYEITQEIWENYMGKNPSYHIGQRRPVENVSWNEVNIFINKLNENDSTYYYRLPTEFEWEYAAKEAKMKYTYSYSGGNYFLSYGWSKKNSFNATKVVGLKKANELGIYDLNGNVAEWCLDWYSDLSYLNDNFIDPKGPNNGLTKIIRGGSFLDDDNDCSNTSRMQKEPDYKDKSVGFRLVRFVKNEL